MLFPIKKITLISISIALFFILAYIEKTTALNLAIPGVKFGFTNIIIIVFLYLFGFRIAFVTTLLKIFVFTIVFGGFSSFLFSFFGSIISFFAMYFAIVIFKDKISQIGVSVLGGFFHILSQYISSYFILSSVFVWKFYPVAVLLTLFTSIITGLLSKAVLSVLLKKFIKL
jgi:heptaprenyl diphosphate synthase